MKGQWSYNWKFGVRNGLKLPRKEKKKNTFWYLQTILRCIVGELAWGGFMALALWRFALLTCDA